MNIIEQNKEKCNDILESFDKMITKRLFTLIILSTRKISLKIKLRSSLFNNFVIELDKDMTTTHRTLYFLF